MAFDKDTWVNLQIQNNVRAFTFRNPLSFTQLPRLATLLDTLRMHKPRSPESGALEDRLLYVFHIKLSVSFSATSSTTRQSYKDLMEDGESTQGKDYHLACYLI